MTQNPVQAFRFLVQVGDSAVISAAFSHFSGVKMEVETIQSRSGDDPRGVRVHTPVLTSYTPVTLSKGVVGDNAFLDWLLSASADEFTGPTGTDLHRSLHIIALDDRGEPAVTWTLLQAVPIGYELAAMDGNRSEVLTESVTFAIHGIKRQTHGG